MTKPRRQIVCDQQSLFRRREPEVAWTALPEQTRHLVSRLVAQLLQQLREHEVGAEVVAKGDNDD